MICFSLGAASLFASPDIGGQSKRVNVLFISSLDGGSRSLVDFLDAFKEGFSSSGRQVEVFTETLDVIRINASDDQVELFQKLLSERYWNIRLDIIFAQSSRAVEAAVRFRDNVNADIPIYCFDKIDPSLIDRFREGKNIFGRILKPPFPATLRLALTLFPETQKALFFVNTDYPEASSTFYDTLTGMREEFSHVDFVPLIDVDFSTVEAELSALGEDSIAFFLPGGWRLPSGDFLSGTEMVGRLSGKYNVPFFGTLDTLFGTGLVGGSLVDYSAMGEESSNVVLSYLFGDKKPVPWLYSRSSVNTLDYRALERFSVPEERIPADARVLFAPPSFWIEYENSIKVGIGVLLVISLALSLLFFIRHRENSLLQKMNAELEDAVMKRTTELEETNANLVKSLRHIEGMQQRLVDDTRDAVLGRVALGIAHEINNPLFAIQNSIFSLKDILMGRGTSFSELFYRLTSAQKDFYLNIIKVFSEQGIQMEKFYSEESRRTFKVRLEKIAPSASKETVSIIIDSALHHLSDEELTVLCDTENKLLLDVIYRSSILGQIVYVIEQASGRIADSIEAVRSYARESGNGKNLGPVSVEKTIEMALDLSREAFRKGVELKLDF